MSEPTKIASHKDLRDWKPGSEPNPPAAPGDFGVPEEGRSDIERQYVSANTKLSDPDAAKPRTGESPDGDRTAGVGTYGTSIGRGSAGDIDTDIVGVGTGGSTVSASGPDDSMQGDEAEAHSRRRPGSPAQIRRVSPGEVVNHEESDNPASGADAEQSPELNDDGSFAGEISRDEASGENDEA